jgi:hypothetical protein
VSKQVVLPCARTPVQVFACMVGARGKGSKEEILGVTVGVSVDSSIGLSVVSLAGSLAGSSKLVGNFVMCFP